MSPTESLAVALAALLAYRLLARWPAATRAAAAPLLLLFAFAGLTFPDIDQPLPLDHRSAVTHSAAPVAIALTRIVARPAAAGLAIGIGVHLAADLFPERMVGYATIKVPFAGSLGGWSYLWLLANAAFCTWVGAALLHSSVAHPTARTAVLGATALLAAWYLILREGSLAALLLHLALAWLTLRRSDYSSDQRRSRLW